MRGEVKTGLTGFTGLGAGNNPVNPVNPVKKIATVHYADLYGVREDKYAFLDANGIDSVKWQTLDLQEPYYFFVPKDFGLQDEYEKGFSIAELMHEQSMGSVSANDDLNISFTEHEQRDKINDLLTLQEGDWRLKTGRKKDSRDWTYPTARADAAEHGESIQKISYRPFDNRFTCYTGKSRGLYSSPQQKIMSHFLRSDNLGLCALRICSRDDSLPVFVTDKITDKTILSSKDNANVFPLYLYTDNMGKCLSIQQPVFSGQCWRIRHRLLVDGCPLNGDGPIWYNIGHGKDHDRHLDVREPAQGRLHLR